MLEFDWDNSVGYWICTTSHTLRRALSTRLAEEKMTLRQWEVLAWLSRKGELSQTQLAECLGIEPHTLTGVVTRMERDGWLKRVPCPTDRRRFSVHPTPRAETVWARAAEWCHEVRQQALIGFSDAEIRSFKGMCERIQQNLGPEATAGADSDCLTAEIVIEPQPAESVPAVS